MDPLDDRFRQALLETIPCAVFILDAGGSVVFWNSAARELTGYADTEMLGQSCQALQVRLAGEVDDQTLQALCLSAPAGETAQTECELRRKDGTVVPVLRRSRQVRDEDGRPLGVIHAVINLSFVRQARRTIDQLERDVARSGRFGEMVGRSPAMLKLYEAIELVAPTDASVVIEGPTGTGKELVARTIHRRSQRNEGPLLAVNCGALPEALLEAELFGHVRGAFTGAVADRQGRFEQADGGTLFLDEVAELSPASQVKLLRVLQEREITRVGEALPRPIDVRIVAATNRPLADQIRRKQFREDLYYRLRVVGLTVPALAERREDIPDLVAHFLAHFNAKYDRRVTRCSAEAMDLLLRHPLPGNVRQLEHALEHAFVVTPAEMSVLDVAALPDDLRLPPEAHSRPAEAAQPASAAPRPATTPEQQRTEILALLAETGGNKSAVARRLGLTRAGLYKRMKRLGVG